MDVKPSTDKSDTPRTDAEVRKQALSCPRDEKPGYGWYLMRNFAQQLERELADMRARLTDAYAAVTKETTRAEDAETALASVPSSITTEPDTWSVLMAPRIPALQKEARDYIRRMHTAPRPEDFDEQKLRFAEGTLAAKP